MNIPQSAEPTTVKNDFVCVGFTLPEDTLPFLAHFGPGGARIKFIPPGWDFVMLEPNDGYAHAMFKVDLAYLNDLGKKYSVICALIKRAYKR